MVDLVLLFDLVCVGEEVMCLNFYVEEKVVNLLFENCGLLLVMRIFGILCWLNCCFRNRMMLLEVVFCSFLILIKLE